MSGWMGSYPSFLLLLSKAPYLSVCVTGQRRISGVRGVLLVCAGGGGHERYREEAASLD